MSFFTFIVNELKFEFNRGDSYQQVLWFIFVIYYLAAKAKQISAPYDDQGLFHT